MIHEAATFVGNYICTVNESDEDTTEVVIYAIEVIFSYLMTVINIIICSYILNLILPLQQPLVRISIFIVGLVSIRKYFGGYHANNSLSCMIMSVSITIIGLIVGQLINFNLPLIVIIYCICYTIGHTLGTIDNPNKRLTKDEKVVFKKKGIMSIKILFILNLLLYYLGYNEASDILVTAIICGFLNLFFSK